MTVKDKKKSTIVKERISDSSFLSTGDLTLPFDQYQRHRLIQETVEWLRWKPSLSLLDVGGSPGISKDFLPNDKILISDVVNYGGLDLYASGLELPFGDKTFDIVMTSDALEHIPAANRSRFLKEISRVAKEAVIIGAPFDSPDVVEAEEILQNLIHARFGEGYHFIEEHRAYGLPQLSETNALLNEQGFQTAILPNGYLHRWLPAICLTFLLQWRFHNPKLNSSVNSYYNSNFYRSDNRDPSYRKVIVATRSRNLRGLREKLCPEPPATENNRLEHLQFLDSAIHVLTENWSVYAQELEVLAEERTQWALGLEQESRAHFDHIQELQVQLEERTAWALTADRESTERNTRIVELEALLEERTAWAMTADRESVERNARIVELEALLEERTQWALELEQESRTHFDHIQELQVQLDAQELVQEERNVARHDILHLQNKIEKQSELILSLNVHLEKAMAQGKISRLLGTGRK